MKIDLLRLIAEYRHEIKEYEFIPPMLFADGITFTLEQREDTYRLKAKSDKPLGLKSLALEFTYQGGQDFTDGKVYQTTAPVWEEGYKKVDAALPESLHFGVVPKGNGPCFFIGTMLPQNTLQDYQAKTIDAHTLRVTAKVHFTRGQADQTELCSEWAWICDELPILQAMEAWAQKQPYLEKKEPIGYGWNSWDYYFETVSHQDIVENVEAIKADPVLSKKIKYITVDDGWSHDWGVWEPNYRFAKGMKYTADYIKEQGFIPGIWTAPLKINFECYYVRRHPELLVKNEYGDPYRVGRRCYIDPTCPAGEKYIYDLYKGLYEAGYRYFKTDFIGDITTCPGFYDKEMGYYEVIRHMYAIIRSAIGGDARILGCNLPAEVGGGIVEANRTGLDIHNDWPTLKRVVGFLQMRFWWAEHIATVDSDFMLVRGEETSHQRPVNILTEWNANRDRAEGKEHKLFAAEEAKTWANISAFCGGNRMLSDRMVALNEKGLAILREGLSFIEHPHYRPLDLGRKALAEYWCKNADGEEYLLIINFEDQPQKMGEGIDLPFAVEPFVLEPHSSIIIKKEQA